MIKILFSIIYNCVAYTYRIFVPCQEYRNASSTVLFKLLTAHITDYKLKYGFCLLTLKCIRLLNLYHTKLKNLLLTKMTNFRVSDALVPDDELLSPGVMGRIRAKLIRKRENKRA